MARKEKPSKAAAASAGKGKVKAKRSALPGVNDAASTHVDPDHSVPFQIVGIGASAGGVEALSELFTALSPDTGMAFVVVQHLDPHRESMIAEIIDRVGKLRAHAAKHRVRVQPNCVYVIPPGKNMVFGDGMLQLSPRTEIRGQHRAIDHFLRSLAEEHGHKSIAVILSGMGNDGSLGIEEIKAAGGITIAQDNSAAHPSMPRSAIATGCIDMVLGPAEIAREIGRIGEHPLLATPQPPALQPPAQRAFEQIIAGIRDVVGVDFSNYKRNTLHRRIMRRMVLHKYDDLSRYADYVKSHPAEAESLHEDILINVTSFFRDAEAYELLKTQVFPALTADRARHEAVRVWALGCSTGEEAYSIAIAYSEFVEASGRRVPLQVFATDLNGAGIEKARAGIYSKGIEQDVSPERLRRYFTEIDGTYRISKSVRDMCIFARQNVLSDPPFSRMDLVACRNVLIYLEPVLQQRLMPMLHYSLRNHGFLLLGTSETIGGYRDLFEVRDAKFKLYRRIPGPARVGSRITERANPPLMSMHSKVVLPQRETLLTTQSREADRILLSRYAPPAVVLTRDLEILQYRGDTGPYLAPAAGRASLNLLKMLREGLTAAVNRAVQKALREQVPAREEGARVRSNGGYREVDIEVVPIKSAARDEALLLLFHDTNGKTPVAPPPAPSGDAEGEIERLRQELGATREYLQSVIEQQDASNEELQSASEEVQSANEELQSTNEELETSKEEIQSANEELETVNDELHARNTELTQVNNDFVNLLKSAHMPIVILGRDLVIRRLTPAAENALNLIPADVGRPLSDIKLSVQIPGLEELLLEVIDTVSVREREVQDSQGRHFLVRVRPYKTLDNKIDGAVMVFMDVDASKRAEEVLRESEARFALLANSAPVLIWVSGPDGLEYANRAVAEFFGVAEGELKHYDWAQFVHPDDRAVYKGSFVDSYALQEPFDAQVRLRRADGEYRWMKSVVRPRRTPSAFLGYVACCFDITDLKNAEDLLRGADSVKNQFIAVLGHELRNPLAAVRNSIEAINLSKHDGAVTEHGLDVINRQTANMVRIVDDLLDISRITHGMLVLQRKRMDVVVAVRSAVEATEHLRHARKQTMQVEAPEQPICVEADAVRLEQIFSNLLINASKFTGVGGSVRIFVSRDGDAAKAGTAEFVIVRIVDSGIGLDPKFIDRIFELFVQAEMPSSSRATGMGLGLPLTKQLVELHGGTITANSDGESQGMTIEVRLPIAPEQSVVQ